MDHKISIITPALLDTQERIDWLNEMVGSVLQQTYKNWELIIVNDGVSKIVYPKWAKDKRIKIINLEQKVGTAIARNTAAHNATGELLLPVDADDILQQNAVEILYNKYEKGKFVYGNVQLLLPSGNGWVLNRTTQFPDFDCSTVLNLSGALSVTGLHSKNDHIKIGGWKSQLSEGLEDVEYWVNMLKHCVLGIRVKDTILQYRKHRSSRSESMKTLGQLGSMRKIIGSIHSDIYEGGNMPCPGGCGDKKRIPTTKISQQTAVSNLAIRTLEAFGDDELVQLKYNGLRKAGFGVVGTSTDIPYRVNGRNSEFLVHKTDLQKFAGVDRNGTLFLKVEPKTMFIHKDKPLTSPEPTQSPVVVQNTKQPEIASSTKRIIPLSALDQPDKITLGLQKLEVTIEKIATEMKVRDLQELGIPGIGPATELKIINKAKDLYYS